MKVVCNVSESNLTLTLQSRRVSFANPIQQQELADDIDRRSPALRTSSPRRSKTGIPQPKVKDDKRSDNCPYFSSEVQQNSSCFSAQYLHISFDPTRSALDQILDLVVGVSAKRG